MYHKKCKMDLEQVNKALKNAHIIPRNKWDYGKMQEMLENNFKDALEKLDAFKKQISDVENKCRSRGLDEDAIQNELYRSFSHEHIQRLERVLEAKKQLDVMSLGTTEELTRKKISILEHMVQDVRVSDS